MLDARDYEVGNNEEASITGEHHFTHDEENIEICSAITYETQNGLHLFFLLYFDFI